MTPLLLLFAVAVPESELLADVSTLPAGVETRLASSRNRSAFILSVDESKLVYFEDAHDRVEPQFQAMAGHGDLSIADSATAHARYALLASSDEYGFDSELWRVSEGQARAALLFSSFGSKAIGPLSIATHGEHAFVSVPDQHLLARFDDSESAPIIDHLTDGIEWKVLGALDTGALLEDLGAYRWAWWTPGTAPRLLETVPVPGPHIVRSRRDAIFLEVDTDSGSTIWRTDDRGTVEVWSGEYVRGLNVEGETAWWWTSDELWRDRSAPERVLDATSGLELMQDDAVTLDAIYLRACGARCSILELKAGNAQLSGPVDVFGELFGSDHALWFTSSQELFSMASIDRAPSNQGPIARNSVIVRAQDGVLAIDLPALRGTRIAESGGRTPVELATRETASSWPAGLSRFGAQIAFVGARDPYRPNDVLFGWDGTRVASLFDGGISAFTQNDRGELVIAEKGGEHDIVVLRADGSSHRLHQDPDGPLRFVRCFGDRITANSIDTLWVGSSTASALAPVLRADGRDRFSRAAIHGRLLATADNALWSIDGQVATNVYEAFEGTPILIDSRGDEALLFDSVGLRGALWRTNGTTAGTSKVSDQTFFAGFARTIVLGDALLIVEQTRVSRYDSALATIVEQPSPNDVVRVPAAAAIGDRLALFTLEDVEHGAELWRTDGTPEGTSLLIDLNPGKASSVISNLTRIGDRVFFWGFDGHAWSMFATDGNDVVALAAPDPSLQGRGPALESDINALDILGGFVGADFAELDGKIIHAAFDLRAGTEPHVFDPAAMQPVQETPMPGALALAEKNCACTSASRDRDASPLAMIALAISFFVAQRAASFFTSSRMLSRSGSPSA